MFQSKKCNNKAGFKYHISSSVGVGADNEEIRLIFFNKRLISNGDNVEIVNESDTQIVLSRSAAIKLNKLLKKYLD